MNFKCVDFFYGKPWQFCESTFFLIILACMNFRLSLNNSLTYPFSWISCRSASGLFSKWLQSRSCWRSSDGKTTSLVPSDTFRDIDYFFKKNNMCILLWEREKESAYVILSHISRIRTVCFYHKTSFNFKFCLIFNQTVHM